MVKNRFRDIASHTLSVANSLKEDISLEDEIHQRFHRLTAPTISHLLALFLRPRRFPPERTSIVIIDSISTLVDKAYPRTADRQSKKNDAAKWAASRKYAVLNDLVTSLGKMAAVNNLAIVINSQTITRVRGGSGAVLVPALVALEWDNGISTRLVIFRDFKPDLQGASEDEERLGRIRFVGITKLNGVNVAEDGAVGSVVPFSIENVSGVSLAINSSGDGEIW